MNFTCTRIFAAVSLLATSQFHGVATASPSCKPNPVEVDVVVVGGGFSGLTAAYDLHRAGLKTVVLEAKEKLGGRSRSVTRQSGPGILELGAAWINNSTQPQIFALTEEFGLETAEQYSEGDSLYQGVDGSVLRFPPGTVAYTEDPELLELEGQLLLEIVNASSQTDIRRWDGFPEDQDVTLEEWVTQRGLGGHSHALTVTRQLTSVIVGREPGDIGAQYFFDYVASGGGLLDLSAEGETGAQSLLVKQGTTAIATGLANALDPGSVHLNTPVEAVTQSGGDNVLVAAKTGQTFNAKRVIVAVPTHTYTNITFTPPLPYEKDLLISHTKPSPYAKVIVSYAEPWWRTAGLVGEFQSATGPISYSWDTSDLSLSQFSLTVLIGADNAAAWFDLPESEREPAVVDNLAEIVGAELADKARDTLEINRAEWTSEEYIRTGPTSTMGPGMLRKYGPAFREAFEGLHFAGGEMAYEWKGYLEGAVRAGQTAAKEVIEALGASSDE